MSLHLSRKRRYVYGRIAAITAVGATLCIFALPAFAANPIEEEAKHKLGGIDPHVNSWLSMQHSLEQFLHPEFMLRLFLNLLLAVACAWVIAWHPRSSRRSSLSNLEQRKTLLLLGMVGAIIAELVATSQTLAFVIFGIGALMRFRTLLDDPKLTVKAITVVVIGLACGMGSWVMAVFVTAFAWVLIFWLDSRVACRLRIRLADEEDLEPSLKSVQSMLVSRGCSLQNAGLNKAKRQMDFFLHIPAELDLRKLESDLRSMLPEGDHARIAIDVV